MAKSNKKNNTEGKYEQICREYVERDELEKLNQRSAERVSTTITTAAAATATTTEPEFAAATANKDMDIKFVGGELGKGVVLLSDAQISSLLDTIGLDAFDYYVDKLATFIIKKDAKVANHYETILKWWQEDAAVRPHV